ncbi:uncharacterized protein LOC118746656 [Rhagoletis pomonella]|uniref:uncharacterized protein LOC118746656 n=1 Tax=Rhagoletis pomonella TaxID=28610 RepID=UPI00178188C0|nr:uncharacterized protein LOC118746656 [Rhagoletis pomonella]
MAPSSEVWRYFTKSNSSEASCKMCPKKVRFCGNTSNLHKHMKVHEINTSKNNVEEGNGNPKPQCSEIKNMFQNINSYKGKCKTVGPLSHNTGKGFGPIGFKTHICTYYMKYNHEKP